MPMDKFLSAWFGQYDDRIQTWMNIPGAEGGSACNDGTNELSLKKGYEHEIAKDLDVFKVFRFNIALAEGRNKVDKVAMSSVLDCPLTKDKLLNPNAKIPDIVNKWKGKSGVRLPLANFTITKDVDRRSINLQRACMLGKGFAAAQIFFYIPGGLDDEGGVVPFHFIFRDLYVTKVDYYMHGMPHIYSEGHLSCGTCNMEMITFHALHGWCYAIQYKNDKTTAQIISGR